MTDEGSEEYFIDKIVDSRSCSRGWRYIVCWVSHGLKEDRWLAGKELAKCEALDVRLRSNPADS